METILPIKEEPVPTPEIDFSGLFPAINVEKKAILAPPTPTAIFAESLLVLEYIFVGFASNEVSNVGCLLIQQLNAPGSTTTIQSTNVTEGTHLVTAGPHNDSQWVQGHCVRFRFSFPHPGTWNVTSIAVNQRDPRIIEVASDDLEISVYDAAASGSDDWDSDAYIEKPEGLFPLPDWVADLEERVSDSNQHTTVDVDHDLDPGAELINELMEWESLVDSGSSYSYERDENDESTPASHDDDDMGTTFSGDIPMSPEAVSDVESSLSAIESLAEVQTIISSMEQIVPEQAATVSSGVAAPTRLTVADQTGPPFQLIIHDMALTIDYKQAESEAFVSPVQLIKRTRVAANLLSEIPGLTKSISRPAVLKIEALKYENTIFDYKKYWVAVGSEEGREELLKQNQLVFFGVDEDGKTRSQAFELDIDDLAISDPKKVTSKQQFRVPVRDMVRDVKWFRANYQAICLAAIGNSIGMVDFGSSLMVPLKIGYLPTSHASLIREMCLHPTDCLAITCDFGGLILATNFVTGKIEHQIFAGNQDTSVSSLREIGMCISCTTDQGSYQLYDRRAKAKCLEVQTILYDEDLYTHNYLNDHQLVMGTSSGQVLLFDRRYSRAPMSCFVNAKQRLAHAAVGDISVDLSNKAFTCFGSGSIFSTWKYGADAASTAKVVSFTNTGAVSSPAKDMSCAGVMIPDTRMMFVSDSDGAVSVYRYVL